MQATYECASSRALQGDQPSRLERLRDAILSWQAHSLLSCWTCVDITHGLLIVGWGAMFFFLLVNWQAMCEPVDGRCEPRDGWYNVSIQILNILFTYGALMTLPWRLSNVAHLWCSRRSSAPGCDFYGRPTDAIWFHIPTIHRKGIILILLCSAFSQLANQVRRRGVACSCRQCA